MARRKKKKKTQAKGLPFIAIVVIFAVLLIGYKNYRLKQESAELLEKQQALEAKVESEEQRAKDLEELEKYMQTKKYAEEVARGKLGLVYPDEVLIEPER